MNSLEKNIFISRLFDFYKNLLTQKQCDIFTSYYFNDIGLTEIASNMFVTKQTVLDSIKQTEKRLQDYEKKLKLYEIYSSQVKLIEEINQTKDYSKINNIINLWGD